MGPNSQLYQARREAGLLQNGECCLCHSARYYDAMLMMRQLPVLRLLRPSQFNARSETVAEKGVFSKLMNGQRCVVYVNSFYEWKKVTFYPGFIPLDQA